MKTFAIVLAIATVAAQNESNKTLNLGQCGDKFNKLYYIAEATPDSIQCAKDSGVPIDVDEPVEEDLKKILAAPVCLKWWNSFIKSVNDISPPCDFLSPNSTKVNSAKFTWTITDFFNAVKQARHVDTNNTKPNTTSPSGTITAPPKATTTTIKPTTTPNSGSVLVSLGVGAIVAVAASIM